MSVTTAEKIFIDPNEEITFVLEKIKNTEKDKVAIVIPQNALILSSLINLALLQRTLWETDKILIIVTEDQYGTNIAQKSGFVVISKLSQLSQELWEIALSKKDRLKREHTSKSNEIKSEEHREEIQEKKESAQHEEITDKKEIETNKIDSKFILIISPEIERYLQWASKTKRMHKAQIVRLALEASIKKDKEYMNFNQ